MGLQLEAVVGRRVGLEESCLDLWAVGRRTGVEASCLELWVMEQASNNQLQRLWP